MGSRKAIEQALVLLQELRDDMHRQRISESLLKAIAGVDAAMVFLRSALSGDEAGYQQWRDFYESRVTEWMTLEQLREEVAKLSQGGSPELLLVHAMHLLEGKA